MKIDGYLKIVLEEMCKRVDVDYNSLDFSDDMWYNKYTWTIKECKSFEKWLSDLVYNDTKARNELMRFPIKRRKNCDMLAAEFVFNYGWKFKD